MLRKTLERAFYLENLKMNNSQQDNENKPAILQEKNENLNRILYFIIAAVMLAPFFIFPHLDVKPFEDEDKVTLEQCLDYLLDVMTQLYQDATLIYQENSQLINIISSHGLRVPKALPWIFHFHSYL